MQYDDGICHFCQHNQYSDGKAKCQECPVSTAPETGVLYKWWNNLPEDSNITSSCLSMNGEMLLLLLMIGSPAMTDIVIIFNLSLSLIRSRMFNKRRLGIVKK